MPIKHVIEIMIENHTFDNLFGSFPGADGIPASASFLNPNAYFDSPPTSPRAGTPNEGDVYGGINNSTVAEQMAMDYAPRQGYLMDHYTVFPQDGMSRSPSSARSSIRTSSTWPPTMSWPTTTSSRSSRRRSPT